VRLILRRFSGFTPGTANSQTQWPSRCGLIVELLDGSCCGVGEASPLPGYSLDTLEDAASALGSLDLRELQRAVNVVETGEALKSVVSLLPQSQSAARMALETAALDLRGHQQGISAPALLGAPPGTERALAWLAGAPHPGVLVAIRRAQRAGYEHFKIKLGEGGNHAREVGCVRDLREALGTGPRLRLDANRAWSQAQARAAGRRLRAADIEFIEEPCRNLTHARGIGMPVALDESLQGLDAIDLQARALGTGASVVVLKPMMLGGLSRCLELGRRAAALDMGVVVSHSFDGPVALAAAAALALALPTHLAQGLAPHGGLAAWPRSALPITRARLRVWSAPGLGLDPSLFD
jgi:o-succinylbenzoate synthase